MTLPSGEPEHWVEKRQQESQETPAPERPHDWVHATSGWGFLICAAAAIGYGVWALYASGRPVVRLDATDSSGSVASAPTASPQPSGTRPGPPAHALGPITLESKMNPLRAVLRAAHAPVGSTRLRYEIELEDASGRQLWKKQTALGNQDGDASIVETTTSLGDFEITRPGDYYVRVRIAEGSMDDLRKATLELRRNVVRPNPRITWGFGLIAVACLIVTLVASRHRPWPYRPAGDTRRTAA